MRSGIYEIRHDASGRRYIGSSTNIQRRFNAHKRNLRLKNHSNRYLQRAWDKYGKDSFSFEVLIKCPQDLLVFWEQSFIDYYKSNNESFGFNIRKFADSNYGAIAYSRIHHSPGEKFGRLTLIEDLGWKNTKNSWKCLCECGAIVVKQAAILRTKDSRSCGCIARESNIKRNKTHGMCGTREHRTWIKIRQSIRQWGVPACVPEWKSFENFLKDMGDQPKGSILLRIDHTKGHSKENCRWGSSNDRQKSNKRSRVVTVFGKQMNVIDAEVALGLKRGAIPAKVYDAKITHQQATDYLINKRNIAIAKSMKSRLTELLEAA